MSRKTKPDQVIRSKSRRLKKAFELNSHGNSRPSILKVAKAGIAQVRGDGCEWLDAQYCASLQLPPPTESHTYPEIIALHLYLVTPQFHPDTGLYDNNLIYSALGLEKLKQAKAALCNGDILVAKAAVDGAEILFDLLDSESKALFPSAYSRKQEEAENHRAGVSVARSNAVKKSALYKENTERRIPVIEYVDLLESAMQDAGREVTNKTLIRTAMQGFDNYSHQTDLTDPLSSRALQLAKNMDADGSNAFDRDYIYRNVVKAVADKNL